MIHAMTPPTGIGCRSMSFLLYGIVGTIVLFLMLLSSILAHRDRTSHKNGCIGVEGTAAIILRWAGKTLGILNGVGIITSSIMLFTGSFDNCFCAFIVFGQGGYVEGFQYWVQIWVSDVVKFWIGVRSLRLPVILCRCLRTSNLRVFLWLLGAVHSLPQLSTSVLQ